MVLLSISILVDYISLDGGMNHHWIDLISDEGRIQRVEQKILSSNTNRFSVESNPKRTTATLVVTNFPLVCGSSML